MQLQPTPIAHPHFSVMVPAVGVVYYMRDSVMLNTFGEANMTVERAIAIMQHQAGILAHIEPAGCA